MVKLKSALLFLTISDATGGLFFLLSLVPTFNCLGTEFNSVLSSLLLAQHWRYMKADWVLALVTGTSSLVLDRR